MIRHARYYPDDNTEPRPGPLSTPVLGDHFRLMFISFFFHFPFTFPLSVYVFVFFFFFFY